MAASQSTTKRGAWAEELAASYLTQRGYEILHRNYRCQGGEIDLIAVENETLVFVEVRSRNAAAHGHPLETIGPDKIARIIHAARDFLHVLGPLSLPTRFDALSILLDQNPPEFELVQEAFEA